MVVTHNCRAKKVYTRIKIDGSTVVERKVYTRVKIDGSTIVEQVEARWKAQGNGHFVV